MQDGQLALVNNIIDSEAKLYSYQDYLGKIRSHDYFYKTKFRDEMIRFPYLYHMLRKPGRNIPLIAALLASKLFRLARIKNKKVEEFPLMKIMDINRALRCKLFQKKPATDLFLGIIDKFAALARQEGFKPVFLFMPQKDDITFIRKRGPYYAHCIEEVKRRMAAVDMTGPLLAAGDLDKLYSEDNVYGGHFSNAGNAFVAREIFSKLKEAGVL